MKLQTMVAAAAVIFGCGGVAHAAPAGPHSKVGDVDLPAGSTLTSYTGPKRRLCSAGQKVRFV
jgi:hypothetical protein